jgi:hypothetical protein
VFYRSLLVIFPIVSVLTQYTVSVFSNLLVNLSEFNNYTVNITTNLLFQNSFLSRNTIQWLCQNKRARAVAIVRVGLYHAEVTKTFMYLECPYHEW